MESDAKEVHEHSAPRKMQKCRIPTTKKKKSIFLRKKFFLGVGGHSSPKKINKRVYRFNLK